VKVYLYGDLYCYRLSILPCRFESPISDRLDRFGIKTAAELIKHMDMFLVSPFSSAITPRASVPSYFIARAELVWDRQPLCWLRF
jgi:hypothetical protein